jgi:predicted GH43/DUF377 family glycosyl hydrolase
MAEQASIPFQLRRLGVIMEPEPGNPHEAEGVLNPAVARGRDGQLYLLPRLVGRGNFSRIGVACVQFDASGDPVGVERLGVALEPAADYERNGCEDPRITFFAPLDLYVMAYTAFSDRGPRVALAVSADLFRWERLGLVRFAPHDDLDFGDVANKDALPFPVLVPSPSGRPALALIHRPLFPGSEPVAIAGRPAPRRVDLPHESLWISFCDYAPKIDGFTQLTQFQEHHRLASPVAPWERVKVGGGAPPVLVEGGWLVIYHGVSGEAADMGRPRTLRYSAGALILDRHDPSVIRYRSPEPILAPQTQAERSGVATNVVFPTGADQRLDLGRPDRIDVYYGMADSRIGVARLDLPGTLPPDAVADPHEGRV